MKYGIHNLDPATIQIPDMENFLERFIKVEEQSKAMHETIHGEDGLIKQVRELQRTVWKASGVLIVAGFLLELYAKQH